MPLAHPVTLSVVTSTPSSRLGVPLALFSSVVLCVPFVALGLAGPKFAEIFRDFGVQLPSYTRLLLDIGNALATPIGLAIAGGILVVWFMAVCTATRHTRPLAIVMVILAILFSLVVLATSVFAFHMPLTKMIEQMQQQP